MKNRFTKLYLAFGVVSLTASTFVSCKDYEGDSIWKENVAKTMSLFEAYRLQQDALGKQVVINKDSIYTLAQAIAANNQKLLDHDDLIVGLSDDYKNLYKKAVADSATLAAADSLNHLHDSLAIKALDVKVDTTVAALTKAYQTADSLLQDQIDSLDARVTKIEEALKKNVTSVEINGTYNPIYGTYAIPAGNVRSTILGTFYGDFDAVNFPKAVSGVISTSEVTGVTRVGGGVVVTGDGATGNAGRLYATLNNWNENNLDFTGKTGVLVKTSGEVVPVTLSEAAKSSDELTYGYSRATVDVPFYSFDATIKPENVNDVKSNVSLENIKELVSEVKSAIQNRQVNSTKIAGLIYNNIHNVLPQLALSVNNAENYGNAFSNSVIAATAIKPLSYTSFENFNYTLNRLKINMISNDLKLTYNDVEIGSITVNEELKTVTVVDANGNEIGTASIKDFVDGLQNQINSKLSATANALNENLSQITKFNDLISKGVALQDKYNNFISRIANYINNANHYLQPVVLVANNNTFNQVPTTAVAGAMPVANGSNLYLTTYTGEMLTPAYKRWIKVNKVYNSIADAATGESGTAVTSQPAGFGEVFDGSQKVVQISGLTSGKVYELVYECIDFHGNIAATKLFVIAQ